ncbi:hypothetical protein AVEN_146122-1 [Araneus ventricosus]|uniref:Uncharacterized protein n=1 Tax=Araneus ventricosus TaxID=182803 RepID=A0A4Y2PC77_ARAVE|nr:hypothetical protein AVEN_146122-1 [Araneus ventricosus]
MAAEAVAANMLLKGGASTSTDSFTMSSGLGLPLPNYSVECLRKRIWEEIDEHCRRHFLKHFTENEFGHYLMFVIDCGFCNTCEKNEKFLSVSRETKENHE